MTTVQKSPTSDMKDPKVKTYSTGEMGPDLDEVISFVTRRNNNYTSGDTNNKGEVQSGMIIRSGGGGGALSCSVH